jgi:hypothetical protein
MTHSSTDSSLVERLRNGTSYFWPDTSITDFSSLMSEAADRISTLERAVDAFADICDELGCERDNEAGLQAAHSLRSALTAAEAKVARMGEALEWYGERARLARLIHSGGDPARYDLSDDGGKRARAALQSTPTSARS